MRDDRTDADRELVEAARQAGEGDIRAFEQLVTRYEKKIVANCRYLTRSEGDAEDLAQEVFVKAYFGLGRFEGRATFRTWLQRIKVNHCLNHLKKQEKGTFVEMDEETMEAPSGAAAPPRAEEAESASHRRARISEILDAMADTLRVPLLLRDMDDLSYQEIADMLGIGLSAVKMRIKRAREQFRRQYRGEVDGSRSRSDHG